MLRVQGEAICEECSQRLAATFPQLCYDAERPDAAAFQRITFRETPRRFHALVLAILRFQTCSLVDQEYGWAIPILARYGVTRNEIIANIRFYFDAVRHHVTLHSQDRIGLSVLEEAIVQLVERHVVALDRYQRREAREPAGQQSQR